MLYRKEICGALKLEKDKAKYDAMTTLMQYCIAGHHTGLPDGGTASDSNDTTLIARLNKKIILLGTMIIRHSSIVSSHAPCERVS